MIFTDKCVIVYREYDLCKYFASYIFNLLAFTGVFMKKLLSIVLIITMIFTALSAATQEELDAELRGFANQIADYTARASAQTNLWADAHIGNLFPLNGFPHLGAGMSAGGVVIPTDFLTTFASAFPVPPPLPEGTFILPALSIDARVGGIILPFDIGAHIMTLDSFDEEFMKMHIEIPTCFSYGADLRFAVLQEGVILPALSVGVGFTHSEGDFIISSESLIPNISISGTNYSKIAMEVNYNTNIYTASVQLSKKILLLTPFVGAKAIAQEGEYQYGYEYRNIDGQSHRVNMTSITRHFSFDDIANSDIRYSVFAGVGVDFLIIQTTAGVSYDLKDKTWAGSLSLHVKI